MIVNAVIARYKVDYSNLSESHCHHRNHERFLDKTFCLYRNQKYCEFVLHKEEQIQDLPPADLWVFYPGDKPQDIVEELGLTESQYLFMIPSQDS